VLAANVDVAAVIEPMDPSPDFGRVERLLSLAWDSGARPVVLLTKADLVGDPDAVAEQIAESAPGVDVYPVSAQTGHNVDVVRSFVAPGRTLGLLGASGAGKSTLVNALAGRDAQRVSDVRAGDNRGRHTTVAAELVALVDGEGWLIDTPGLRAVSLWASGTGIERSFADVFDLAERCRFRDCKHEDEPGCAVQAAIAAGTLDPRRLTSMKRLVAEEAALEEEQLERVRATDRRGYRRTKPR
jgi:ribosome biogenesis GTPase / thiamine phosphate phosphatase